MSRAYKKQACVSWCAIDIQTHRPDWSVAKCRRFLEEYEDLIQSRMIEIGWDVIRDALRWREDEERRGVSTEQEDRK